MKYVKCYQKLSSGELKYLTARVLYTEVRADVPTFDMFEIGDYIPYNYHDFAKISANGLSDWNSEFVEDDTWQWYGVKSDGSKILSSDTFGWVDFTESDANRNTSYYQAYTSTPYGYILVSAIRGLSYNANENNTELRGYSLEVNSQLYSGALIYLVRYLNNSGESKLVRFIVRPTDTPSLKIYGDFEILDYEIEDVSRISGEPYVPGGSSATGGGGGNFGIVNGTPETSDPIAPSLPPYGSYESGYADSGLFTLYALNSSKLKTVGEWLWTSDLGVRVMRELLSIVYASPIESAISLISYPFDIPSLNGVSSVNKPLYWGSQQMSDTIGVISAPALLNPYATIDWGTIQLNEFWGNFLDYAPHTKLELYLPWCTGFVPIDPNECLPGTIRVVTNIELAKGTCLHNVIGNDGRVIATHAGTCGKQLPLTALDTSGKALAFVTAAVSAATVVGGTMAGAAAGAMTPGEPIVLNSTWRPGHQRFIDPGFMPNMSDVGKGAMSGARKSGRAVKKPAVLAASVGLKGHVQISRNGSFNGSSAGLGVQFPYLIISRPTQSVPAQYGHHYGYPSNIYTPLANLRGYTEVGEIHLTGFVCTEEELEEIDSILKGGVIL